MDKMVCCKKPKCIFLIIFIPAIMVSVMMLVIYAQNVVGVGEGGLKEDVFISFKTAVRQKPTIAKAELTGVSEKSLDSEIAILIRRV